MNTKPVDLTNVPGIILIPDWEAISDQVIVVRVDAIGVTFEQWQAVQSTRYTLSEPESNGAVYILDQEGNLDETIGMFVPFTVPLQAAFETLKENCMVCEVIVIQAVAVPLDEFANTAAMSDPD